MFMDTKLSSSVRWCVHACEPRVALSLLLLSSCPNSLKPAKYINLMKEVPDNLTDQLFHRCRKSNLKYALSQANAVSILEFLQKLCYNEGI